MGATHDLAAFAVEAPDSVLPDDVLHAARRAILDALGVALAGTQDAAGQSIMQQALHQGGEPESLIWGSSRRVSAQNAALANGTVAHVLDFDDTNDAMRGHPSVPVLPAVFAMGERVGAAGGDVLRAFAIGVEIECTLGRFTGQEPYDHGFHVTATHGVIGATAGAGRLAGLALEEMQHAIGIAVSQASGVRQNFGTMTKSLHVGRAAQSAILAVELARRGFTASADAIEGTFGYWGVFGRDEAYQEQDIATRLGNPFELVEPGLNVKAYPCCASTHAAIDAALIVRDGTDPRAIERVVVQVPYTAPLILIHHRPEEPLAAKFSLEYCVAAALIDGPLTLDHFAPDAVQREDVQSLLRRVDAVVPDEWQKEAGGGSTGEARIDVYLADGTVRHAETTTVRGSALCPLTDDELEDKFLSCAERVIGAARARDALGLIRDIERLGTIRQLSDVLAMDPPGES